MFYEVLIVLYLIVAILLIGIVLIQQGKGADMGASFGGGGSNTVFGSAWFRQLHDTCHCDLGHFVFLISLILGNQTANTEQAVDQWDNLEIPVDAVPAEESDVPASDDGDVPN